MIYLLLWWFLLVLLGFAALPVTMRLLRFLPDNGYAFAKPVALLLWVYPFWLLAVSGFIQNSFGALAFLMLVLAVLSWGVLRGKGGDSVIAWLRTHWKYALVVELVFALALFAFAYFRAFNPEISATEKPMEFMFLNSILSSATFPPHDAWLSGYGISYYYLGYVIVAALAKLGNVPPGYAFNLGLIMTYALAAVGAFSLMFNLVSHARGQAQFERGKSLVTPYFFGIMAVVFLLVVGNLEGVFEVGYNAGIGPREFYSNLDLHSLDEVQPSGTFVPKDNWWWWRASRVVNDINPVGGGHSEIIDEFPAFSFLLGDLHPHVLSLPFCVLALAVALNVLLQKQARMPYKGSWGPNLGPLLNQFLTPRMLLVALIVGALGMLNTWDIVTYGFVIAAAFAIAQYRLYGKRSPYMLATSVLFAVLMFAAAYVLFLPFYFTFATQARGVAPNIFNRTPLAQYLIMWGLFIFVIVSFVAVLFAQSNNKSRTLVEWGEFAVPFLAVPVLIALAGAVILTVSPSLRELLAGQLQIDSQDATQTILRTFAGTFVASPGTFLLLVVLLSGIVALGRMELTNGVEANVRTGVVFALLLALVGLVLTFGVEFLYIRDTFETRMNTVFKLYYQSWLLLAMAATFGLYHIWRSTHGLVRGAWVTVLGVLVAASLVYPALAYPNRANNFDAARTPPTLDGWAWVERYYPDDYAAIEWLRANAPRNSVILEAAGSQYSFDNRVSVATGLPTVLGWGGHELQWRGNSDISGPRENDIEQVYKSRSLDETRSLLAKYGVDYVIVGAIERDKYKLNSSLVDKFGKLGGMVFEQGSMRIYQVGQAGVSLNTR